MTWPAGVSGPGLLGHRGPGARDPRAVVVPPGALSRRGSAAAARLRRRGAGTRSPRGRARARGHFAAVSVAGSPPPGPLDRDEAERMHLAPRGLTRPGALCPGVSSTAPGPGRLAACCRPGPPPPGRRCESWRSRRVARDGVGVGLLWPGPHQEGAGTQPSSKASGFLVTSPPAVSEREQKNPVRTASRRRLFSLLFQGDV